MWKHDLLKSLFAALLLCAALFCSAGTVKLTVIQTAAGLPESRAWLP